MSCDGCKLASDPGFPDAVKTFNHASNDGDNLLPGHWKSGEQVTMSFRTPVVFSNASGDSFKVSQASFSPADGSCQDVGVGCVSASACKVSVVLTGTRTGTGTLTLQCLSNHGLLNAQVGPSDTSCTFDIVGGCGWSTDARISAALGATIEVVFSCAECVGTEDPI